MKKAIYTFTSTALIAFPAMVSAQSGFRPDGGRFGDLLNDILQFANDILIPFIIGIGFLVFVYGMFKYFIYGGDNDDEKEKGKSLMIWATLGFVIIVIFWGVVNLLADSSGFAGQDLEDRPRIDRIN